MKPETVEWLDKAEGDWKVAQREIQAPDPVWMDQNDTLAAVFAAPRPARQAGGNTTGPGRVYERKLKQDA
jgi:hypothetical protein